MSEKTELAEVQEVELAPRRPRRGVRMIPSSEQRRCVEIMALLGATQEDMADALSIHVSTLRKHFQGELKRGKMRTLTRVADRLVQLALGGNVAACIFIMKARAGWRETQRFEHADARTMSVAELEAIARGELESG